MEQSLATLFYRHGLLSSPSCGSFDFPSTGSRRRKGDFMKYDTRETGARIRDMRTKLGLTQEQMAEELNVSPKHIGNIETGTRSASIDLLVDIALMLDVSLDYLILGREPGAEATKQKIREAIDLLMELEDSL
jgi:DNA-binding XRE family transcriptional regulator